MLIHFISLLLSGSDWLTILFILHYCSAWLSRLVSASLARRSLRPHRHVRQVPDPSSTLVPAHHPDWESRPQPSRPRPRPRTVSSQCQYGSLFSQNFKTQTFIAGLVMTNFILIARYFQKLVIKLTVSFGQRTETFQSSMDLLQIGTLALGTSVTRIKSSMSATPSLLHYPKY